MVDTLGGSPPQVGSSAGGEESRTWQYIAFAGLLVVLFGVVTFFSTLLTPLPPAAPTLTPSSPSTPSPTLSITRISSPPQPTISLDPKSLIAAAPFSEKRMLPPLTGVQVAESSAPFIASLAEQSPPAVWLSCHADGSCARKGTPDVTTHAWKMMAYAGLFNATGNESYRNSLARAFTAFNESFNGPNAFWALVQPAQAYIATNDSAYLRPLFLSGRALRQAVSSGDLNASQITMLHAIASRELALLYRMLGDPAVRDSLTAGGLTPRDENAFAADRRKYLDASLAALSRAHQLDSKDPLVLAGTPGVHTSSCWIQLAYIELFEATGNSSHINSVTSFFSPSRFSSRRPQNTGYSALVEIHPCIESLQYLTSRDDTYLSDLDALYQWFLLPYWDASVSPRCVGTNGFLAALRNTTTQASLCANNDQDNTDAAYSIYLLSREPRVITSATIPLVN